MLVGVAPETVDDPVGDGTVKGGICCFFGERAR